MSGEFLKTLKNYDMSEVKENIWKQGRYEMVNHKKNRKTILIVEKRDLDKVIPEGRFSLSELQEGD